MARTYQMYEIEAYFGDYFELFDEHARSLLERFDWQTIEAYMDRELTEEIHFAIAPCSNYEFLLAYMMAHTEKYGDDFVID